MENLKKLYLRKDGKELNSVYLYLRTCKNNNFCICKKIDTIYKTSEIVCSRIDDFKENFYNATELISTENYIGKSGYYKDMAELDIYIYKTYVILYKDSLYELIYDTIEDTCIVNASSNTKEDFIPFSGQPKFPLNRTFEKTRKR